MSPELKKMIMIKFFNYINFINITKCNIFSLGIILIMFILLLDEKYFTFNNKII